MIETNFSQQKRRRSKDLTDIVCVKTSYGICTRYKMMTVTWHWVLGDPLGARMQRVKHVAHLLAVWHLSAGQGEQLEEGAQKERTADWWSRHGRRAELSRAGRNRAAADNFSTFKVTGGLRVGAGDGEAAAQGSAWISILPLGCPPSTLRPPGKPLGWASWWSHSDADNLWVPLRLRHRLSARCTDGRASDTCARPPLSKKRARHSVNLRVYRSSLSCNSSDARLQERRYEEEINAVHELLSR